MAQAKTIYASINGPSASAVEILKIYIYLYICHRVETRVEAICQRVETRFGTICPRVETRVETITLCNLILRHSVIAAEQSGPSDTSECTHLGQETILDLLSSFPLHQ